MASPPARGEVTDARIKQQARQLQTLLAQLMRPPTDAQAVPLPEIELSPREVNALLLLGDKGQMSMTDLAALLQSPLSTLTRIMDRLEAKSLVERFRSDEDRRVVMVRSSEDGKSLHGAVRQCQLAMAERMLEPLTSGEREILLELMVKLVGGLKATGAPQAKQGVEPGAPT